MPRLSPSTTPAPPDATPLDELLDRVQRATVAYFWEGAHPVSGHAYDRRLTFGPPRLRASPDAAQADKKCHTPLESKSPKNQIDNVGAQSGPTFQMRLVAS